MWFGVAFAHPVTFIYLLIGSSQSADETLYIIIGTSSGVFIVIVVSIILMLIYCKKKYVGQGHTLLHELEEGELYKPTYITGS